ncbi:hypothetical protein D3C71_1488840 [compost metagenome]
MPRVQVLPVRQDQPVPEGARHAGQGRHARRHLALQLRRQAALPLHGLLDVQRILRRERDLAGQDQPGRPARKGLPAGVRRDDRPGRRAQHREGQGRRHRRRVRPGRHRPGGDPGRGAGQGRPHHRRGHQPEQVRAGQRHGRHRLHQPQGLRQAHPGRHRRTDRWRRGLLVRVHRQRARDARGAGMLPQGLGRKHHHRRGRRGPGNQHAPVPTGHRPRVARFGIRRREGPHATAGHG